MKKEKYTNLVDITTAISGTVDDIKDYVDDYVDEVSSKLSGFDYEISPLNIEGEVTISDTTYDIRSDVNILPETNIEEISSVRVFLIIILLISGVMGLIFLFFHSAGITGRSIFTSLKDNMYVSTTPKLASTMTIVPK